MKLSFFIQPSSPLSLMSLSLLSGLHELFMSSVRFFSQHGGGYLLEIVRLTSGYTT